MTAKERHVVPGPATVEVLTNRAGNATMSGNREGTRRSTKKATMPESARPKLGMVLQIFAGVAAVALIALLILDVLPHPGSPSDATQSPSAAPTQATPTPTPIERASEPRACVLAYLQLAGGDAKAAKALLDSANITKDNADTISSPTCAVTWSMVSRMTASASEAKTPPQQFGSAWDEFVKGYATPFAGVSAFLLGSWLGIFVLARLLVELFGIGDLLSTKRSRRAALAIGWGALFAVPIFGVPTAFVTADRPPLWTLWAWILLGIAAIAAAVILAGWLATRRRLTFTVTPTGDGDEVKALDSTWLVGTLTTLVGAAGDFELPAGPQVSDLKDSLSGLSSVSWIAAVQKIVFFLVGSTPWAVTADVKSASAASLLITRNGRTLLARSIRTDGPGLDALSSPPGGATRSGFLVVFIAAEIVMTLRTRYAADLDPALYGATDGTGVALQYIASRYFVSGGDDSAAESLAGKSLDFDPYNELAQYTLEYIRHRKDTGQKALHRHASWLTTAIEGRIGVAGGDAKALQSDVLLYGMTSSLVAAARNLAANAAQSRKHLADAQEVTAKALSYLRMSDGWGSEGATAGRLRARKDAAQISELALTSALQQLRCKGSGTHDSQEAVAALRENRAVRDSAGLAYNLVCFLLRWRDDPFDDDAKALLATARAVDPLFASFMSSDPELMTSRRAGKITTWLKTLDAEDAAAAAKKSAASAAAARAKKRDDATQYVIRLGPDAPWSALRVRRAVRLRGIRPR